MTSFFCVKKVTIRKCERKNNMKNIKTGAAVFAAALCIISFAACTGQQGNGTAASENNSSEASEKSCCQGEKETPDCCRVTELPDCCKEASTEEKDCCKESSSEKSDCCNNEGSDISQIPDCCGG